MRDELRVLVPRDPLATAILPILLHGLNNATQVLSSLNALLALDERGEVLASRSGDLAYASRQVDELGWLLALVGSASGADVLMARRERTGLRPLVACVRDGLRREHRDLAGAERVLPGLTADVADGWQLPWTIGSWLWASAQALEARTTLDWAFARDDDRWELRCDAPWGALHDEVERRARHSLPDVRCLRLAQDAIALRMPASWLAVEDVH